MDSEQPAAKPQVHHEHSTQTHSHAAYPGDYPSNPFTTAVTGVKTFWENGKGILAGIIGFEFLLLLAVWLVLVMTVVAGVFLLLSTLANANLSNELTAMLPQSIMTASNGLANVGPASSIILLICFVLMMLLSTFLQAEQTAFVGKTVALRQKPTFGEVVKTAFRRMWALLAQTFLLALIFMGALLAVGLLASMLISINPVLFILPASILYLGLFVACVYFFARIAFAGLGVVIGSQGPWQAIKHSFAITKGHVGEVIGIGAVGFVLAIVVGIVINLLQYSVMGSQAAALPIIIFLIVVFLLMLFGLVFMAIITERYAQLVSLAQTKVAHKTEWGSIVGAVAAAVLAFIVSGVIQYSMFPITPQNITVPELNSPELQLDPNQQNTDGVYDELDQNMTEEELQEWLNSLQNPTTGEALYQ